MIKDNNRKKTAFQWIGLFLKYGAGVAVAIISVYAARQDKAKEARIEANNRIKMSYEEQSKQIVQLQLAVEKLEKGNKEIVDKCKAEVDTIRSNMTFFLMGENKARNRHMVPGNKELLSELLKTAARSQQKASGESSYHLESNTSYQKPKMFKRPKKFDQLIIQKNAIQKGL